VNDAPVPRGSHVDARGPEASGVRLALVAKHRHLAGVPPARMYRVLAQVNRRAATRDDTIGPASHTSHVTVTGEFGSAVDGWPEDREYMPAYIDMFGLGLQPEVDEHGNPKPVKLMGMSGFGYSPSRDYFNRALREKGEDSDVLNNYGAWLADAKGTMTRQSPIVRLLLPRRRRPPISHVRSSRVPAGRDALARSVAGGRTSRHDPALSFRIDQKSLRAHRRRGWHARLSDMSSTHGTARQAATTPADSR
jgi:hypothetical protein